jgi:hypothetical protein
VAGAHVEAIFSSSDGCGIQLSRLGWYPKIASTANFVSFSTHKQRVERSDAGHGQQEILSINALRSVQAYRRDAGLPNFVAGGCGWAALD